MREFPVVTELRKSVAEQIGGEWEPRNWSSRQWSELDKEIPEISVYTCDKIR